MEKRPRSPSIGSAKDLAKKQKTKYNKVSVNLNQRLSKAIKDVLVTNLNESFREKCLRTLDSKNGSEAGEKVEKLIVKFKDNKKQKAIKENSGKINENSQ